jgi:short-subunit dehydrogenase
MAKMIFRTALVTGASAGIGAEYARQLAAAGTNLVLVARRLDKLTALARDLEAKHGIKAAAVKADLATEAGVKRVERIVAGHPGLDLLVNNAGFGGRGGFVKSDVADHLRMVRVHVEATVRLTKAAIPGMVDRGRGAVVNVSSVAAFSPSSGSIYSGTKAFQTAFSENLHMELKGKGIAVQALCPGMTHTEFHAVAEFDKTLVPKPFWMTAEKVVRISLRKLGRGVICVPGWKNKVIAFLLRCPLTLAVVRRIASRLRAVRRRAEP